MKKIVILVSLLLISAGAVLAQHFWRGETMSSRNVEKKWGSEVFDPQKFKSGTYSVRAKMAFSLLQNKKYLGKSPLDVRSDLGDPDGYYFSDMYPAYIIEEGASNKEDTWQVVFLLNRDRKISEIIVHKNCCK